MPRIRILTSLAGDAFSYRAGEVVDVSAELAGQWCDGVRAELVRGETPETPERAGGQAGAETTATKSRSSRSRKSG